METATMIVVFLFWSAFGMLVLTYFAYPMLAAAVATERKLREKSESLERMTPDQETSLPRVSCLVPAYNEADVIEQKIKNFLSLDYPGDLIELVIGDDGSDDETRAVVSGLLSDKVKLLPTEPRSGKATVMNRLVEAAQNDFLLFSDANVMLEEKSIRILARHMNDPSVGAVTGEVTLIESGDDIRDGESAYYSIERRIQGAESHFGSVIGVDGGLYLMRREHFRPLPFDTLLDDFVLSMNIIRSGYRVVYDGEAKACESGTPTAKQEFSRRVRIAAGAVQLLRRGQLPRMSNPVLFAQFVAHKLLRWVSPILFITAFVTSIVLFNRHAIYACALYVQIAFWLASLLVAFSPKLRTKGMGALIFYFGISQAAMLCGLCKGILNRQSVRWDKTARDTDTVEAISHRE